MLQVVLAVLGLTLAWTTFRIGHDASSRREIAAARGLLTAVRAGIVEHDGGKSWGEAYLSTTYTDASAASRAMLASEGVVRGTFDQVFVVPTEPLELLARAVAWRLRPVPEGLFEIARSVAAALPRQPLGQPV